MNSARQLTPRPTGAPLLCVLCACLLIAPAVRAATNNIIFDLGNFGADSVAFKQVKIAPALESFPRVEGVTVYGIDYGFKQTDANGRLTNSMVSGSYKITFTNRFLATTFQITVPSTNASGYLYASELTTSGTNLPSNLVAYSQTAADGLFAKRTNALQSISTNGVPMFTGGVTNVDFTTGVTGYVSGATVHLGVTATSGGGSGDAGGTNARQFGTLNLTNWSNIPTGEMANVPAVTFLTNSITSIQSTQAALVSGSNAITSKLDSNVWQNSWGALSTNALTGKLASNSILGNLAAGAALTNSGQFVASLSGFATNFQTFGITGATNDLFRVNDTNNTAVTRVTTNKTLFHDGAITNSGALDVAGNFKTYGNLSVMNFLSTGSGNLTVGGNGNFSATVTNLAQRSGTIQINTLLGAATAYLHVSNAPGSVDKPLAIIGTNTTGNGLTVSTNGQVGIGTATPVGILTVANGTTNSLVVSNTGTVHIGQNVTINDAGVYNTTDSSGLARFNYSGTTYLQFNASEFRFNNASLNLNGSKVFLNTPATGSNVLTTVSSSSQVPNSSLALSNLNATGLLSAFAISYSGGGNARDPNGNLYVTNSTGIDGGAGGGEANVNGEISVTNATRIGLVNGKSGVTNLLRSLQGGVGITLTNEGTNVVIATPDLVGATNGLTTRASNLEGGTNGLNAALNTPQLKNLTNLPSYGFTNATVANLASTGSNNITKVDVQSGVANGLTSTNLTVIGNLTTSNLVYNYQTLTAATNPTVNTNLFLSRTNSGQVIYLTNSASLTNFFLVDGEEFGFAWDIYPQLVNRTLVYPALGSPAFGIYWRTNANAAMWTTLTQGIGYTLSGRVRGTNIIASITEWK